MNFFKKLFGTPTIQSQKELRRTDEQLTADEQFAVNFTPNGGRFIYCTTDFEVQEVFRNILKELGIYTKISSNASPAINAMFEEYTTCFSADIETSNVYLIDCEYLITSLGGIMLSSSQMVKDISEGMRGIKKKYINQIPTGLITLKCFSDDPDKSSIATYGTPSKKTYLILLEDLPIE